MKTLFEILEEVADGGKPDYDDLRYSVVALSALRGFDHRALGKLAEAKRENKRPILTRDPEYAYKESFERYKKALSVPPKTYVGPSHDPDTEECRKWRTLGKKILVQVEAKVASAAEEGK